MKFICNKLLIVLNLYDLMRLSQFIILGLYYFLGFANLYFVVLYFKVFQLLLLKWIIPPLYKSNKHNKISNT